MLDPKIVYNLLIWKKSSAWREKKEKKNVVVKTNYRAPQM